ncbi:MAG: OsmC family protein [Acidimicrobiia bacterium]|nr:OsmC family protein [Acidimicrobiia bacterium]
MGEVEKDGRVLILRRIHVTYHLSGVAEDQKDAVERVHEFHARYCPVARSIEGSIEITTELEYV